MKTDDTGDYINETRIKFFFVKNDQGFQKREVEIPGEILQHSRLSQQAPKSWQCVTGGMEKR